MTISKELLLSVLAMDSYNRGYDPGIADLGGENSQVGTATLKKDAEQLLAKGAAKAAGFYALSYTISGSGTDLDGKTVISYRGTDAKFTPFGISGSDLVHGCGLGGACTGNR